METFGQDMDVGAPKQTIAAMDEYLFVSRPVGYVLDSDSIRASAEQITSACQDAGMKRVLIFGPRTYIRASEDELADLARVYAEGGLKIAIVESHNAGSETTEFFRSAARERGAAVQFFEAIREAADWLEA